MQEMVYLVGVLGAMCCLVVLWLLLEYWDDR